MLSLQVTHLYVYPIKSLAGIALDEVALTSRGFRHDREWMLVDSNNRFISQREIPELAKFIPCIENNLLKVSYDQTCISIDLNYKPELKLNTTVWDDTVYAETQDPKVNQWFSTHLKTSVRLVRKTKENPRGVKNHPDTNINFADGSQFLIIGEASLHDLNSRLDQDIPINRFRPNIVVNTSNPYAEDEWNEISIGRHHFISTKLCSRCIIINTDQHTSKVYKEPLKTLSTYRKWNNKVYFGQFLKLTSDVLGSLKLGSEVQVIT